MAGLSIGSWNLIEGTAPTRLLPQEKEAKQPSFLLLLHNLPPHFLPAVSSSDFH